MTKTAAKLIMTKMIMTGRTRLTQVLYDTPAKVSPAIKDAIVGAIILRRPLAVAKATTMVSLLEPTKSATGARIGIEAAARPDDDGIIKESGR